MALFEALEGTLELDKSSFTRGLQQAGASMSTFGGAAESTFSDVGDEASDASTRTRLFGSSLSDLAGEAREAVVPTSLLANRLDEAGDEASQAGRKAALGASGFAALSVSSSGLSMSFGVLSSITSVTALAIGGLTVAIGALAVAILPVIVGFGAMAAMFGLIVGSGIIAWGEGFKDALEDAKKQIVPLVKEFGSKFIPFLKETIGLLPSLVKEMLNAIGPIDPFVAALRTLRNTAFDLLPKFISWWAKLGRWALPILTKLGGWIVSKVIPAMVSLIDTGKRLFARFASFKPTINTIVGALGRLWRWFQDLIAAYKSSAESGTSLFKKLKQLRTGFVTLWQKAQPLIAALIPLSKEFVKLIPTIQKLTIDVLTLATKIAGFLIPILTPLVQFITKIFRWFNTLSPAIKRTVLILTGLVAAIGPVISIATTVIGVIGSLVSIVMTVVGAIGTFISILTTVGSVLVSVVAFFNPISLAIAALVAAVVGLYVAWKNNFFGIRDIVNNIISTVADAITGTIQWVLNQSKRKLNQLKNTVQDTLRSAANWIKRTGRRLWNNSFGALARAAISAYNSIMPDRLGIPEVRIPRVSFRVPGLTIAGHEVYDSQSVGVGPFGPFGGQSVGIPQLATGGHIESPGMAMLHEGEDVIPAAEVSDRESTGGGSGPTVIDLTLDLDGEEVRKLIEEGALEVIRRELDAAMDQMQRRDRGAGI